MKRMIKYIASFMLIFCMFAACTDTNSGISEEVQLEADSRAVSIVDSLEYGSLIVNSLENKESGLSFSSPDVSTLLIEFKNYSGNAVSSAGNVEEIQSGVLVFEFSENARAFSKTYTVKTETPLMVLYKDDDTTIPVEFESNATACQIDFESTESGITGISSNTVQFTKPIDMSFITIDGIEADTESISVSVEAEENTITIVSPEPPIDVPSEPEEDEDAKKQEATEFFLDVMKSFDVQQFISDVLQTHRDIGGVSEGSEGTGNTALANYKEFFDGVNLMDLLPLLGGTGEAVLPLTYDDGYEFKQGLRFNSLSIVADKDAATASVTLEIEFMEDYVGCFSDGSAFAIKSGSIAYLLLSSSEYEFAGYGAGKENITMPLDRYSVSTEIGSDDVENPTSFIIKTAGEEKKISISGLTGEASGKILGDIQMSGPGLEISLTIEGIGAPTHEDESISIDGIAIDYAEVLAAFNESQIPDEPAKVKYRT